jgi:hypothetical protein
VLSVGAFGTLVLAMSSTVAVIVSTQSLPSGRSSKRRMSYPR